MKKKTIVSGLVLLCLMVPFSFASGTEEKSAAASGPVSLRFSWWGNDTRHKATISVLDRYTAKNPNVKIEPEYRGKSEREKIATELASGTVADIVQLNPPWMGDFNAAGNFFVDLSQYSSVLKISGFDRQFLNDYCMDKGKLIALPTGLNARTVIINKTLAARMGIPVSLGTQWTWNDLYEWGKKVNQTDNDKYLLNADTVDMVEFVMLPYLVQKTGNQLIKDDYTRGFTDAELKEALTYIAKLYKDKVVQSASDGNVFLNSPWTNPKWINGDMVFELTWTSLYGAVTADNKNPMGVFSLPVMKNAKNTAIIVTPSQLLAVSSKSRYPEEAAKFLNYFFNDREAGLILKDVRAVPPVADVQAACEKANLIDKNVIAATQYAQKHQGLYRNDNSSNAEIVKILNDAAEKVAYDSSSVNAVTDVSVKLIDYVLAELKAK